MYSLLHYSNYSATAQPRLDHATFQESCGLDKTGPGRRRTMAAEDRPISKKKTPRSVLVDDARAKEGEVLGWCSKRVME